ncbi:hypothetical protein ABPG72_011761 [Tetrahymena utriculariae]
MGACVGKSNQTKYCINVKAKIWEKDTPNLFDFETDQIIKRNFVLKEKDQVVAYDQELIPLSQTEQIKNQVQIFDIRMENGVYSLKAFNKSPDFTLWRVIRDEPSAFNQPTWNVKKGDTIKLGRILLKIEDFSHTGNISQNQDLQKKDDDDDAEQGSKKQINLKIIIQFIFVYLLFIQFKKLNLLRLIFQSKQQIRARIWMTDNFNAKYAQLKQQPQKILFQVPVDVIEKILLKINGIKYKILFIFTYFL